MTTWNVTRTNKVHASMFKSKHVIRAKLVDLAKQRLVTKQPMLNVPDD